MATPSTDPVGPSAARHNGDVRTYEPRPELALGYEGDARNPDHERCAAPDCGLARAAHERADHDFAEASPVEMAKAPERGYGTGYALRTEIAVLVKLDDDFVVNVDAITALLEASNTIDGAPVVRTLVYLGNRENPLVVSRSLDAVLKTLDDAMAPPRGTMQHATISDAYLPPRL